MGPGRRGGRRPPPPPAAPRFPALLAAALALLALAAVTRVAQAQTVPSFDRNKYRIGVHSSIAQSSTVPSPYSSTVASYIETAKYLNNLLVDRGLTNRTVEIVPISFLGPNLGVNFYAWSILALSPPILDAVLAPSASIICLAKANPGARPMAGLVSFLPSSTAEEEVTGPAMISKSNMTSLSDITNRRLAFYDPTVRREGRPWTEG